MKITISRRQNIQFIPEDQDDVEEGKRLELTLRPLSLALEEQLMDGVFQAKARNEEYTGDAALINRIFRASVIGWKNLDYDDGGQAIPFADGWGDTGLPEEITAAFDQTVRVGVFGKLLAQAGMRGEDEVGKSE